MQKCKTYLSVLLVPLLASTAATAVHATPPVGWLIPPQTSAEARTSTSGDLKDPLRQPVTLNLVDVPLASALEAIARRGNLTLSYSAEILPRKTVTLHTSAVAARDALARVLDGTGLEPAMTPNGQLTLTQPDASTRGFEVLQAVTRQTVTGTVTDAGTGEPLGGAEIRIDGSELSTLTDAEGRYTLEDVPPGTHTLVANMIGYAEGRRALTIAADTAASVNFALTISAVPLDEMVVTGTMVPTEMRAVPAPVSVITAQEIEAKGTSNVASLLLGEVPGVMPLSAGQADFTSQIYVRGNASGGVQDVVKVYIDGIELAHPTYLSTINARSIERIEIIRGPQASVIYGSEASSGVLQIFTKKGHSGRRRPSVELLASMGVTESRYTPDDAGTPLTWDYSLEVNGGSESFSYRAGGSYTGTGEWLKNYGSNRLGLSTGLRAVHGPLTAEFTALWSDRDLKYAETPIFLRFPPDTSCPQCGNPNFVTNYDYALSQNTIGLTLSVLVAPKWKHTLTLGEDRYNHAYHQPEPSYNTPADTFVLLHNDVFRRQSIRYHTTYTAELVRGVETNLSAGLDYWRYHAKGTGASNLLSASGTVQTTPNTTASFINDVWWNAGYFGLVQLNLKDQVFLTLATRVEHNAKFGEEFGRAVSPRLGASYVHEVGPVEMKLRAQWGKGVRPPPADARAGRDYSQSGQIILPNPAIAPEEKAGWDAGIELYWGSSGSLSLTRFDEEGRNLIQAVPIDLTTAPARYQRQNVGMIGSEGWEVEGTLNLNWMTLSANYAYSDNTVREVSEDVGANPDATLKVGDRPVNVPKHSGGGRFVARHGRASMSLDASVMAGWRALDFVAYYGWLYANEPYRGSIRAYYRHYPALWKWNLRANMAVSERLTAFVRVENLMNNQNAPINNWFVAPGRTTVAGVRYTF